MTALDIATAFPFAFAAFILVLVFLWIALDGVEISWPHSAIFEYAGILLALIVGFGVLVIVAHA